MMNDIFSAQTHVSLKGTCEHLDILIGPSSGVSYKIITTKLVRRILYILNVGDGEHSGVVEMDYNV